MRISIVINTGSRNTISNNTNTTIRNRIRNNIRMIMI